MKYREKIYKSYGDTFGKINAVEVEKVRLKNEKLKSRHLRNWLQDNKNSTILDVGCGTGEDIAFYLSKGYKNVSGVDLSVSQLNYAKSLGAEIKEGEILDTLNNTPKNSFDLISAYDVIEHLTKDEVLDFLSLTYKSLSHEGALILRTPNASSLFASNLRYGDFTHELSFSPECLEMLMKSAGYKNIELREIDPVPFGYSFFSSFRYILWQIVRLIIKFINLIETGNTGTNIYSRVFIVVGKKVD